MASGEYNFYSYVHDTNNWIDPLGLEAIANKVAGDAREAIAKTWLENKFANAEILSERYIQDIKPQIRNLTFQRPSCVYTSSHY